VSERGRVVAVFALLTLIWGTTWAAIRVALEGIPPLTGVAIRFTLAGAVLLAWARWRGVRFGFDALAWRLWLTNALFTFVGSYGLVYWAEQTLPSGLTSILWATFPLWVVLLGRWMLPAERVSAVRLFGVGLGFAGMVILFSEDLEREIAPGATWVGTVLLAAPLMAAVASLAMKRWGGGLPPESLSAMSMLLGGLLFAPVAAVAEHGRSLSFTWRPWLATAYLAVVGSAVTFPLYFWLLARRSAVKASLISYTAPIIAVVVGIALFDEPMTGRLAAGAACILAGVAAALRSPARPAG
jgi:drug/metabolite transporter (DMT)-like permease